jgi:hypothetical protein
MMRGGPGARPARWWLVGALALLSVMPLACTTDPDVVEDKKCTPTGPDPNKDCIQGYLCKCEQLGCFCRKGATGATSALRETDHAEQAAIEGRLGDLFPSEASPVSRSRIEADRSNRRFLRRQGLQLAEP